MSMFDLPLELYPSYIEDVRPRIEGILCSQEERNLLVCVESLVKETLSYRERDKIRYNISIYTTIAENILKNDVLSDYLALRESLIAALDVMLSTSAIAKRKRIEDISSIKIHPERGDTLCIYLN